MTEKKKGKLAHEILGLLGASFAVSIFLYEFLTITVKAVIWNFCEQQNLVLSEIQLAEMESWVFNAGLLTAVLFFVFLFLALLGQKLAYIRTLTAGVAALREHRMDYLLPLEGSNELTQLAESINYLSATEKAIREKEQALQEEKEALIRSLSHDIRTPLTSILAYSDYLATEENCPEEERQRQLQLIRRKAEQIRDLTDVLLEGGHRNPEYFEDVRLLMEQLADEFEESLEDFTLSVDFARCKPFGGSFDVQELRRIFDNLSSNIRKYADAAQPVRLTIVTGETGVIIRQENRKKETPHEGESFGIGLASIRRIAQRYHGSVAVEENEEHFAITVQLLGNPE